MWRQFSKLEKDIVAVLFLRTGIYTFPSSKYKSSTFSKLTEALQYQIYCLCMCQMSCKLNVNFTLCSIPAIDSPPTSPKDTRHKSNILRFYLLLSDEPVF